MSQLGFVILIALHSTTFAQPEILHNVIGDDLAGTFAVLPLRESADGKLIACGFEFSALTHDRSTKKGAPVKIVGSLLSSQLFRHRTLLFPQACNL